jgi:DNA-binding IclR family transcriptional regulator
VEKFESLEPLRIFSRVGANVPLHCSAVGKVFLAFLPHAEQVDLLNRIEFLRYTPATIGSIQAMQTELGNIRRLCYAIDNEEHEPHIKCIAGPVWDHEGAVAAALSITGPATRMHRARIRDLVPLIKKTGLEISEALGYSAPSEGSGGPRKRR